MIVKEDIKPITYLKTHTSAVLEHINTTHRAVVITQNGEAKAVIQDPETYDQTQKAICLLKMISQSEKEISSGKGIPQDDVFTELDELLNGQK